jgi:hypothetical protein
MRTIGLIERAAADDRGDLWLRLQARLDDDREAVRIPVPAVGWRDAAALAVALGALAVVPDTLRFLAASGML